MLAFAQGDYPLTGGLSLDDTYPRRESSARRSSTRWPASGQRCSRRVRRGEQLSRSGGDVALQPAGHRRLVSVASHGAVREVDGRAEDGVQCAGVGAAVEGAGDTAWCRDGERSESGTRTRGHSDYDPAGRVDVKRQVRGVRRPSRASSHDAGLAHHSARRSQPPERRSTRGDHDRGARVAASSDLVVPGSGPDLFRSAPATTECGHLSSARICG